MTITILPRRHRHHPTMQPLQLSAAQRTPAHPVHRVRVRSTTVACQQYRDGAALLRDLGMAFAASLLERTANALQTTVTPADDDTVVANVPNVPITIPEPK